MHGYVSLAVIKATFSSDSVARGQRLGGIEMGRAQATWGVGKGQGKAMEPGINTNKIVSQDGEQGGGREDNTSECAWPVHRALPRLLID